MLSSQVVPASRVSIPPILLYSSTILRSGGALPRRPRPHYQIRTIRFGLWPSYLDPSSQKEVHSRNRAIKHKYIEALNRKLAWDRQNPAFARQSGFKGFMCSAWRGNDAGSSGSWIDINKLKAARSDAGKKQSIGIEDVEQSAFDKLLDGKDGLYNLFQARSRIFHRAFNNSSYVPQQTPKASTPYSSPNDSSAPWRIGNEDTSRNPPSQQNTSSESDYKIDPITNRKVFRNKLAQNVCGPTEVPVKTFKGYRSQFQKFQPPVSTHIMSEVDNTKEMDSNKPHKKRQENRDPVRESLKDCENGESNKPFFTYEPGGKAPDPVQQGLKDYDSRVSYQASPRERADTAVKGPVHSCPVQEGLKDYDRRAYYSRFGIEDPIARFSQKSAQSDTASEESQGDGAIFPQGSFKGSRPEARPGPVDTSRKGLEDHDSKTTYGPILHNEPDGKAFGRDDMVREGLKDFDATTLYGPVLHNEPDGKLLDQHDPVQEGLKDFDSTATYGPVQHNEPDGKAPSKEDPVQEGLKDFDGATAYGPVRYNEPDGKAPNEQDPVARGLSDFDKKENYGARRILKNISLNRGYSSTDRSFRYQNDIDTREDLDLLRQSDVRARAGIVKRAKKESAEEKLAKREDLENRFQKLAIENSELRNIASHLKGRIDSKLEEVSSGISFEDPKRKLTGNFVRDFPEEFERKWTSENSDSGALSPKPLADASGYDEIPKGLELSYEQEVQKKEKEFIDGLASKERFARKTNTPRLETSLDRSNPSPSEEKETVTQVRLEPKVSQDFKKMVQDFKKRYADLKLQFEPDSYSKKPQGLETSYTEECKQPKEIDPYSKKPQGLETSYAEEVKRLKEIDPYSKEPKGLELSYAEECAAKRVKGDTSMFVSPTEGPKGDEDVAKEKDPVSEHFARRKKNSLKNRLKQKDKELVSEVRSIYEDQYGTIDCQHRQVASDPTKVQDNVGEVVDSSSAAPEPTVYKILAYDPTMQSISTAETTSIVPDSATALTPAEVLLRLSNPAKFFPHFGPLQAQGYEIVSGSGDVLVFRKVRLAGPPGVKSESSSAYQDRTMKNTNPIDGMQSTPVAPTGNFASPTGFVNHDLPGEVDPPFKSNIDVRREEPVFSGKSTWSEGPAYPRRKKVGRVRKMLIGAAWVGGLSYTLGVVAEYFRTGGADGLGPKGF
jgi:hypothetical protein